jgi:propanediol utilization protein
MSEAKEMETMLDSLGSSDEVAYIPVAVSARHVHLSRDTIERLFGKGYELRIHSPLAQHGQFSAEETISLIGPGGRMDGVRLVGPPRQHDQVELSRSDALRLGLDAPIRQSGDLERTPRVTVQGPRASTVIDGVICARRHIHCNETEAQRLGVVDGQVVQVKLVGHARDAIFGDIVVRVAPQFSLQLHLDTDEANAVGVASGDFGMLLPS